MTSTENTSKNYRNQEGVMDNKGLNHLKKQQLYLLNNERVLSETNGSAIYAPINISENPEYYQVQLFAAGRVKEQFNVKLNGQILKISCRSTSFNDMDEGLTLLFQEQKDGSFERVIHLEKPIVNNRVFASFENGILTVILQIQQNGEEYEQYIPVS